ERLRAPRYDLDVPSLPAWASIEEDTTRDPHRYARVAALALSEDERESLEMADVLLGRPATRVFYLRTPEGDQGLCLVTALGRSKKSERRSDGSPTVGLLEQVGLARACRGKGLSRPLVRAGLRALAEDDYGWFEVI